MVKNEGTSKDAAAKKRVHRSEEERVRALADKATAKVERMQRRHEAMVEEVTAYGEAVKTAQYEADLWNQHPLLADDEAAPKKGKDGTSNDLAVRQNREG